MTSADAKMIKSGLVSGFMLVELVQSWVSAVNDGKVCAHYAYYAYYCYYYYYTH